MESSGQFCDTDSLDPVQVLEELQATVAAQLQSYIQAIVNKYGDSISEEHLQQAASSVLECYGSNIDKEALRQRYELMKKGQYRLPERVILPEQVSSDSEDDEISGDDEIYGDDKIYENNSVDSDSRVKLMRQINAHSQALIEAMQKRLGDTTPKAATEVKNSLVNDTKPQHRTAEQSSSEAHKASLGPLLPKRKYENRKSPFFMPKRGAAHITQRNNAGASNMSECYQGYSSSSQFSQLYDIFSVHYSPNYTIPLQGSPANEFAHKASLGPLLSKRKYENSKSPFFMPKRGAAHITQRNNAGASNVTECYQGYSSSSQHVRDSPNYTIPPQGSPAIEFGYLPPPPWNRINLQRLKEERRKNFAILQNDLQKSVDTKRKMAAESKKLAETMRKLFSEVGSGSTEWDECFLNQLDLSAKLTEVCAASLQKNLDRDTE